MMKKILYIVLAASIATTSCRRSEIQHDQQGGALQVEIERQAFEDPDSLSNPASKATETAFEPNDSIGIYVHTTDKLTATGNHTPNLSYATANGTTWTAGGYLSDLLQAGTTYTATGYYPYDRLMIDPTAFVFTVRGNQTTPQAVAQSELMYAAPTAIATPTSAPKLSLSFKHLFTKITLKFAIPPAIDGAVVTAVDRVDLRGVYRAATVDLSDGTLTKPDNQGDVTMHLIAGDPTTVGSEVTYQAIAIPQTIKKGALLAELSFATASGARKFTYRPDADEVWVSNLKRNLHLVSVGDLCFTSRLDLTDGLAHADLALKIKAPTGSWTLTSPAAWLTLSTTEGGTYGASISGTSTGAEQTIYVSVTANTAASGVSWLPRSSVLTLTSGVLKTTYTATQNFYRFGMGAAAFDASAGQSTFAVAPFASNQEWKATGSGDWLKISPSAEFGAGEPKQEYTGGGSVGANELFVHIDANNTAAAREGTVTFTPATAGGTASVTTIKQPVALCALNPKAVGVSKYVSSATPLFTVTVPKGVRWKLTSVVSGGVSDMSLSMVPAVGAEQIGTGEPQQVVGSYTELVGDAVRYSDVAVAWASYGADQQSTVRVTQNPESVVIGNLRWATGNLVASNAVAGMRGEGGCRVGAPTDGGVYFQFGSLIGYKGGDQANGGTGAGSNSYTGAGIQWWGGAGSYSWANDAMVWPTGMAGSPATWPTNTTNQWYFGLQTGWSTAGQNIRDFPNLATGGLANKGVGDPCTYYLGGTWRLPTTAEYVALCNSQGGLNVDFAWDLVEGSWTVLPTQGGNLANNQLFFSASGSRNYSDGTFYHVATGGYGWSSSNINATLASYLGFYDYLITPQTCYHRSSGFPVRCVQSIVLPTVPNTPTADDYVTINNLKWAKGNLVAVNQSNAKIGKPEDGGIYFQFGSLIGYKGGNQLNDGNGVGMPQAPLTTGGTFWNGTGFSWASDAMVWPTNLSGNPTEWPQATAGTTHQWFFSGQDVTSGKINATNATKGVGDPCAYYLGGTWRLPLTTDYAALFGNVANGTAWGSVTGWDWQASPSGAIGSIFFPVSGLRHTSGGSFYLVTSGGYGWSSSIYNATHGLHLHFNSSSVYPQSSLSRSTAFPVRCVSN